MGDAFENVQSTGVNTKQGVSTPQDLEAVRTVFQEVAVAHVAQVRNVMLELRFGQADMAWLDSTRPALSSLRAMAAQMELRDLCEALDAFCTSVERSITTGESSLAEHAKDDLLQRYQRLIELIPQAFELDAERDRREPVIVEALLFQVEGVERHVVDKLFAVGLSRLDALLHANTSDLVSVTGLRPALAAAIVHRFRSYRDETKASVSARDPAAELRELSALLVTLAAQSDDFDRAAAAWSDEAVAMKRAVRKQREQTFQQIKVVLARLGARDQLTRLEKLPFRDRIGSLERYLQAESKTR